MLVHVQDEKKEVVHWSHGQKICTAKKQQKKKCTVQKDEEGVFKKIDNNN